MATGLTYQLKSKQNALLCVANFPSNVGYAWDFIEGLFAHLANHFATYGIRTFVAYPKMESAPRTLTGSAAQPVLLDTSLETSSSVRQMADFVRCNQVNTVYFTDRPPWSMSYWRLRQAGAQRIIVHDHTSGARVKPLGMRKWTKWLIARMPWIVADRVLTVSDYVARRQIEVGQLPSSRVKRIHNGLAIPSEVRTPNRNAYSILGLPPERPIVFAASRAAKEKGIAHLLRAFDRLRGSLTLPPLLVYVGDGPQLTELQEIRSSLASKDDIVFTGYRRDATELMESATLCVIPSVWQDAFPTSVLEALLRARPVVATRVGGIPEMIEDNVTGLLVDPGDEIGLAEAMRAILVDPSRAERLGKTARQRAIQEFSQERQIQQLISEIQFGFGAS